uniref:Uncharacterized protein n=1 Tax=Plectus sambesii TaxID=2011161 RepID=A0A914UVM5_9BILA
MDQAAPAAVVDAQGQDEMAQLAQGQDGHDNEYDEHDGSSSAPPPSISPTMVPVALSKTAKDAENERVKNVIYGMLEQQPSSQSDYTVVRTWNVSGKNTADDMDDAYDPADPADDYFIPPHMSESEMRQPADLTDDTTGPAQNVGDLLVAIHTIDDPVEVAELVQNFLSKRGLEPIEQQIVLKALANKVSQEKARRGGGDTTAPAPASTNDNAPTPKLISTGKQRQQEEPDIQLDEPAMSFLSQGGPPSFLTGEWRVPPRSAQHGTALPPVESLVNRPTNQDDDMDIEDGEIGSDRETSNEKPAPPHRASANLGNLLLPPPPPPPNLQQRHATPRQMPLVPEEAGDDHLVATSSARQPKRPSRPWNNTVDAFSQPPYDDSGAMTSGGQWTDFSQPDGHSTAADSSASSHHYESNEYVKDTQHVQDFWNDADHGPMPPPPPWARGHGAPPGHLANPGPPARYPRPPFRGRGAPVFGSGM